MTRGVFSTIGYEGAAPAEFTATLQRAGVAVLLDIRDVPYSRKPGFSQTPLAGALRAGGIDYVHLKGLGNPKAGREAGKSGDHDAYLAIFGAHLQSAAAVADMARAAEIATARKACLLCFERMPADCHRNIVAARLSALTGLGVEHLFVEKEVPPLLAGL
jgi:uncharacterized protein (DUF488 family)